MIAAPLIITGGLNSFAKRGAEASVTDPMTVPLQSSQTLHRLVGPKMEVLADAEVQDRELPTVCFETRRGGREILSEEETEFSLFDVESSLGSSTVQVRMAWHQLSFPMSGSWRQMVQDL